MSRPTRAVLTCRDMVGLLVRVEGRCRIELGFPTHDAVILWPEAVDRIFADEWEHLTSALLGETS